MEQGAIWEEPVRGGFLPLELLGLPGREQMAAFIRRGGPPPPLHHLTGMVPTEVGDGVSVFTMPATPWLLSPVGVIQGGMLAVLADGPLGGAIQTALPAGTPYTTSEMSLSFIRPATPASGLLTARGRLIHAGRSLALSEVRVEDGGGQLLAHGTSRCFMLPAISPLLEPPDELPPVELPTYDTPDPYLRPVQGEVLLQEAWERIDGLEMLRRHIAGDLPAPPIHFLTGLRPVAADEGRATFALPCSGWLCSPTGFVEGGFIALLADTAIASAVQTTLPARTAYTTVDLKVNYLRPVPPDGRDLLGHGTMAHRGRSLAVARAEVVNADGKAVAVATGTAMILPGRAMNLGRPLVPEDEPAEG